MSFGGGGGVNFTACRWPGVIVQGVFVLEPFE